MKRLIFVFAFAFTAFAQLQTVNDKIQRGFNTAGLMNYVCEAPVSVSATYVSVSGGTLTSIAVSSLVGTVTTVSPHYLYPGAYVTVSGSSTSALNGSYTIQSTPSSTTYTITTAGVSNATYTTGLVITTSFPLYSSSVWKVTVLRYDDSNVWEGTTLGGGALSMNYRAKCSDRAIY